ncbi:MAG: hypothetical protein R2911_41995 [Caldilineaceae bacterium]
MAQGVLLITLHVAGPYEGMNITGVTGISDAQRLRSRRWARWKMFYDGPADFICL